MKPPDEKTLVADPSKPAEATTPAAAVPPAAPKGGGITTSHDTEEALAAPPAAQQAAPPAAPAKAEPKRVRVSDADDELPDDADIYELPKKDFDKRMKRASGAELKKLYERLGVKDGAELDAKFARVKEGEAAAEAARVAQLSNEQRLTEENARLKAESAEWRAKHEQTVTRHQIDEQHAALAKVVGEFIDPDYVDVEMELLGRHLVSKYRDDELADLPEEAITGYLKDRVAKKPKLGKDAASPAAPPPPERRPLGAKPSEAEKPAPAKGPPALADYRPKKGETPAERRAANAEIRQKFGISF